MEHLYPGAIEPVQEVIEGLLSLPHRCGASISRTAAKNRKRKQTEKDREEALLALERSLTERSGKLAEQELSLKERWDAGRIYQIPVGQIVPNPYQPRREFDDLSLFSLADSISRHGVLQPLTVRRLPEGNSGSEPGSEPGSEEKRYSLICGERRLRAALAAGLDTVPCVILDADNRRAAELAIVENLQRENLNMFEQAGAIAALIDMHAMTQEQIARTLSVSQSCIANRLRILRLNAEEREIILSSHLTERHARAFLRIREEETRLLAVKTAAEKGLNVAQTEEYVDTLVPSDSDMPSPPLPASPAPAFPAQTGNRKLIIKDLRMFFNTVDRAVTALKEAGISAALTRKETEDGILVSVLLPFPAAKDGK